MIEPSSSNQIFLFLVSVSCFVQWIFLWNRQPLLYFFSLWQTPLSLSPGFYNSLLFPRGPSGSLWFSLSSGVLLSATLYRYHCRSFPFQCLDSAEQNISFQLEGVEPSSVANKTSLFHLSAIVSPLHFTNSSYFCPFHQRNSPLIFVLILSSEIFLYFISSQLALC